MCIAEIVFDSVATQWLAGTVQAASFNMDVKKPAVLHQNQRQSPVVKMCPPHIGNIGKCFFNQILTPFFYQFYVKTKYKILIHFYVKLMYKSNISF